MVYWVNKIKFLQTKVNETIGNFNLLLVYTSSRIKQATIYLIADIYPYRNVLDQLIDEVKEKIVIFHKEKTLEVAQIWLKDTIYFFLQFLTRGKLFGFDHGMSGDTNLKALYRSHLARVIGPVSHKIRFVECRSFYVFFFC